MKTIKAVTIRIVVGLIGLFFTTTLKAQTLAGADGVFCKGASVSITAATDPNAVSYIWKRYVGKDLTDPAPTTIAGQNTATLSETLPTTPGYYTYVSIAVNAGACESDPSDPKTVYVLPDIAAGASSSYANNILCEDKTNVGTLTANPSSVQSVSETFSASDYSYQWNKNGSPIAGATASTYTLTATDVATSGSFTYSVTINYKDHTCTPATSSNITLTVAPLAGKPVITLN